MRRSAPYLAFLALLSTGVLASGASAAANVLCVNSRGTSGCYATYATIGDAVTAAAPNDVIKVGAGEYDEAVVIGKPLSLIGANVERTIINAAGLSQGIYIDGVDNPGLSNVVVSGFTVENANYEGILIASASSVTVRHNRVLHNNQELEPPSSCPGLVVQFPFETAEAEDCGEGIHLTGVSQSTISDNLVKGNSGGILVADETGPTHDNLISGNEVRDNPFDCGITLASHPPAPGSGSGPYGVFENTIADNISSHNGYQQPGAGAGVGIFDSAPGTMNYANVIVGNRLTNNGLPGVTFHTHIPGVFSHDNIVVGNYIAGNGPDTQDAATSGPTGINVFGVSPVTGTVIANNVISFESIDVSVHTAAQVDVHSNDFLAGGVGVANTGGTVNATENWWGCARGPGNAGCASVSGSGVLSTPWLTRPAAHSEDQGSH